MEKTKSFAKFAHNLRLLRIERKLSQERLAELADVDRTYIYRLENGLRLPSLPILVSLAKAFELTPGTFLDKMLRK